MKKLALSIVASVSAGQRAPKKNEFSDIGAPFVRAGSLDDLLSEKNEADLELVSEETAQKRRLKLYPKGAILFAKSGMSATKDRIYVLYNPAYVVSHLAILTPNDKICADYLRLALKKFPPSVLIKDPAYPAISLDEIRRYKVPVHEKIDDQKRIAHLLGKVEGLIARRKQHLQQLVLRPRSSAYIIDNLQSAGTTS
jgi:type I restriction enzyme S subunit